MRRFQGLVLAGGLLASLSLGILGVQNRQRPLVPIPESKASASLPKRMMSYIGNWRDLIPRKVDACSGEFEKASDGLCWPLNPLTGKAYGDEDLKEFERMRSSPLVASNNYFVPHRLTPLEMEKRNKFFSKLEGLHEKVMAREASEDEIDEYFNDRARLLNYRLQLIEFLHKERGGRISENDPNLELKLITDAEVKDLYSKYQKEHDDELAQYKAARLAAGYTAEPNWAKR